MIEINVDPESWDKFAGQTDDKLMSFGVRLSVDEYVRIKNAKTGSGVIVRIAKDLSGPLGPVLGVFSYRVEFLIKRG